MNAMDVLSIVLMVVTIVLVIAAIYAVRAAVLALRDIRLAVSDTRDQLEPLLAKADVTVNALNAELLRLDQVITKMEGVGGAVSTVSEFVRAPAASAAQGIAKVARGLKRSSQLKGAQSKEDA